MAPKTAKSLSGLENDPTPRRVRKVKKYSCRKSHGHTSRTRGNTTSPPGVLELELPDETASAGFEKDGLIPSLLLS
jgi:hypothetical protein